MKFEVERYGIVIIPEGKQDDAYIEDTLGLRKEGDSILLVRQNSIGMPRLASLQTEHPPRRTNE